MATSPIPQSGSHQLELAFGGADGPTPVPPKTPRRRRVTVIFTVLGVVALAAALACLHWGANVGYDDALESFDVAVDEAGSSRTQLGEALTELASTTDAASSIQEADTGNLMDAAARDALTAAVDEAVDAETEAGALAQDALPSSEDKPDWTWELFAESARLNEDRAAALDKRDAFDSAHAALAAASDAVDETGVSAVHSAAGAADAFEGAHVSARNTDILSLRSAAEWLSGAAVLDAATAEAYLDLETAALAMLASEQEEIAEKQGPLYQSRVEIEAFARELAPDVLLDFDWSPVVNGFGEAGSMAGYATWWYGEPGYANIELSNSVAEQWPSDRSKALVAHEVGHAISVKCQGMYDDSDQETIEAWATAWAISMGFHDDANGTSAYGAPPQAMIDAAAGCR